MRISQEKSLAVRECVSKSGKTKEEGEEEAAAAAALVPEQLGLQVCQSVSQLVS